MNNLTLGNDDFTYYETLGGGQGACADADGPSAVHVAMSNTLNTPIEALEARVPAAGGRVRPAGAAPAGRTDRPQGTRASSASMGVLSVFDIATCTALGPSASAQAPCPPPRVS